MFLLWCSRFGPWYGPQRSVLVTLSLADSSFVMCWRCCYPYINVVSRKHHHWGADNRPGRPYSDWFRRLRSQTASPDHQQVLLSRLWAKPRQEGLHLLPLLFLLLHDGARTVGTQRLWNFHLLQRAETQDPNRSVLTDRKPFKTHHSFWGLLFWNLYKKIWFKTKLFTL